MKRKRNGRFMTMKTLLNFIDELLDEAGLNNPEKNYSNSHRVRKE